MLKITATNLVFGTTRQQRLEKAFYWLRFHLVNHDPSILPLSEEEVTKYQSIVANGGNAPAPSLKKIISAKKPKLNKLDKNG